MDGISCDRCGESLLVEEDVRYLYTIEMVAAYDPLELTRDDLDRDFDAEYRALLKSINMKSPEQLEEQVYVRKRFDLCAACQRSVLANPLSTGPLENPPEAPPEEGC